MVDIFDEINTQTKIKTPVVQGLTACPVELRLCLDNLLENVVMCS